MTLGGWPAASSIVAAPCRKSWNRTRGRPSRATTVAKCSETAPGRSDEPSSRVNTRPVPCHTPAHAIRSASYAFRHAFSTSAVPGSTMTTRSESSDLVESSSSST
jgi:hypothetical protein